MGSTGADSNDFFFGADRDPSYEIKPGETKDEENKNIEIQPSFIRSLSISHKVPLKTLNSVNYFFFDRDKARRAHKGLNHYVIDIYVATSSLYNNGRALLESDIDDYYDITLDLNFTPSKDLKKNFFLPSGYRIEAYPLTIECSKPIPLPSKTCIVQPFYWCPHSTTNQGKSNYTEVMQMKIGGQVGGGYPQMGTAGANTEYSITHQYSRDVADIDIIATMPINKVVWDIKYNHLSLKPKHGYCPDGTFSKSFRWIWKVNRKHALDSFLYRTKNEFDSPSIKEYLDEFYAVDGQLYFLFNIKLFGGIARMHTTGKRRKIGRSPLFTIFNNLPCIFIKVPPEPDSEYRAGVDKKTTISKATYYIENSKKFDSPPI